METETLAFVTAAMFLAAFIKGVTGLGFSTSAVAMLVLLVGIKTALPLLILPSLASNAMVMLQAGHFVESARRFAWMYIAAIAGVALGITALALVDPKFAGGALGAVLLTYATFTWRKRDLSLPPAVEKPLAPFVGLTTGAVNGLTGSQVMPVLPYLMALKLDPNRFVQAINISFTLSSLTMAIGLSRLGLITRETLLISLGCIIPVLLGVHLGTKVRHKLHPETFRSGVLLVLGLSGIMLIIRAA